ncbi:DUF1655 domain-containing protein [Lactococcus sp. dk322]|nr:DUF1655 domain-containing protein [Lactococcus sp. dk101]TXK36989.1 DUF1655 domain-containing protein [Lactococcus sp. dk310]TXK47614.1 DUF1655 domain-containing protein [Lactococcus sp. dk322]
MEKNLFMKLQFLLTDEIASQLMELLKTVTKHHISTERTETLFDHRRNVVTFTLKNEGVLVEFVGGAA